MASEIYQVLNDLARTSALNTATEVGILTPLQRAPDPPNMGT